MSLTVNQNNPVPQNLPTGGANQAQLGGAPVQAGNTGSVRRTLSEIGNKVQTFFKGLTVKFDNWQEGRAVKQATAQATKAADRLTTAMTAGALGPQSFGDIEALMKNSARADSAHPNALASQLLATNLAALPQQERTKACFSDLAAAGTAMKAIADQRIDAADTLQQTLHQSGLGAAPQGNSQALKTQVHGDIDAFVTAAKDTMKNQRVADLRTFANGAFNVAADGRVSGTIVNGPVPAKWVSELGAPRAAHGAAHTPASLIESRAQGRLDMHADGTKPFNDVGGIPVSSQAVGDFHRMNFNISNNGQVFNTKLPPNSNDRITSNVDASVAALRAYTGSDEATTVLSSMLHQYDLRDIVHGFAGADGNVVDLKPLPNGFNQAQVNQPNGVVETFAHPGQIGDAQINLTHTATGDFKIDVTWSYLSSAISDENTNLPTNPSNPTHAPNNPAEAAAAVPDCIKVNMTASFTVSAADAAAGRLTIDPNAIVQRTFSGMTGVPA